MKFTTLINLHGMDNFCLAMFVENQKYELGRLLNVKIHVCLNGDDKLLHLEE
jgi:hypothetical protein